METLKHLLLEDPLPLCILLGAAEAIILLMWHLRRTRAWAWRLVGPPALALGLIALSSLVTTRREHLTNALGRLKSAVEANDLSTVREMISPEYSDRAYASRQELLSAAERAMGRYRFEDLALSSVEIEFRDSGALTRFGLWLTVEPSSEGRMLFRWTVFWAGQKDQWRITSARLDQPLGLPGAPEGP